MPADAHDGLDGWAVAAIREESSWRCVALPHKVLDDLSAVVTALRELRSAGAAIGLMEVDEEFFVLVRPRPRGVSLLISDATAAGDYDIAADVLEALHVAEPDSDDDPFAEGDLGLLADLGLPEPVLGAILADDDMWPDEQLEAIAERCGFGDELSRVLDTLH